MDSYPMTAAQLAARVAELEQECERLRARLEVRNDGKGKLDEIVGHGEFHLERMSTTQWWLGLYGNGNMARVFLCSNTSIRAYCEVEPIDAALSAQRADGPKE